MFDLDRIRQKTFISSVDFHESISSTNTRGLELSNQDGRQLPLLILAHEQTAGRGRGENRWWSQTGALTFSVLLEQLPRSIPQQKTPLVSLFTGLAVADALDPLLSPGRAALKWPNDVYVEGRKLCGILVETTRGGVMVIGVGVNVNNSVAAAPQPLRATATSLVDITQREWDRTDVLIAILRCLQARLESMDEQQNLAGIWRERCYLEGRIVQLDVGSRSIRGVCQGIDKQGALVLQTETGVESFFAGVVAKIE